MSDCNLSLEEEPVEDLATCLADLEEVVKDGTEIV
jgi:hypothetical protein